MKFAASGDESRSRPGRWLAFTLLELLTVMAIIGLLASLLLPVLSSARNHGSQTVDINNLRQVINATHLYATNQNHVWCYPDSPSGR